jgi:beta-lactamase class D
MQFFRLFSLTSFLLIFSSISAEERFLLVDGASGKTLLQIGSELDEQLSPCSTFKIPLSLMGYDVGILKDEEMPTWEYQEGYDDFLETWKAPQSPQSWMRYSCVWYSKLLSCYLGLEKMQSYLAAFKYGNEALFAKPVMPGSEDPAWFHDFPLKISPKEQIDFICKIVQNELPVGAHALKMTKAILFKEELLDGWKLFGKTGWSGHIGRQDPTVLEYSWFVGWAEKEKEFFPFAYLIRDKEIALDKRIPRVKELLINTLTREKLICSALKSKMR